MSIVPDFASALGDLVGVSGATGSGSTGIRSAWVFTSRLRQSLRETASSGIADQAQRRRLGLSTGRVLTAVGSNRLSPNSIASSFFADPSSVMDRIVMAVNPNSVTFKQPKRFNKKDTKEGSVFFHFTNSRGQNNDILTMEFAGNTGNIDLRGSAGNQRRDPETGQIDTGQALDDGVDTGAIRKMLVWHNLYLLSREPMLLVDNLQNEFTITYSSQLFPTDINFIGFFNQVLDFTEDAKKPHSRNYRFGFTVQRTDPSLDDILPRLTLVLNDIELGINETAEIFGPNVEIISP